MERNLKIGDHVAFVDSIRVRHEALVTNVFDSGIGLTAFMAKYDGKLPAINVLYVTDDAAKTDPYGHQVERATSVGHGSAQAVRAGMYYLFPDEE
jgi:hypothetical protein